MCVICTSCVDLTLCEFIPLHECKAPLRPNNTSCFTSTFVYPIYFMTLAYFNAYQTLHADQVLLCLALTSCTFTIFVKG